MITTDPGNKALLIETVRYCGFWKLEQGQGLGQRGQFRDARTAWATATVCAHVADKLAAQPANVIDLAPNELRIGIECLKLYARGKEAIAAEHQAALNVPAMQWDAFSAKTCLVLAAMLEGKPAPMH